MLTEQELHRIRRRQEHEIVESRTRLTSWAERMEPAQVLSVGEGNDLYATWLGHVLRHDSLPTMTRGVALDRRQGPGSFHTLGGNSERFPTITPLVADAIRLPFANDAFDIGVASLMIDDCSEPLGLLRELARCCTTGGLILISGHGLDAQPEWQGVHGLLGANHPYQLSASEADDLCGSAGLELIHAWTGEHAWARAARVLD